MSRVRPGAVNEATGRGTGDLLGRARFDLEGHKAERALRLPSEFLEQATNEANIPPGCRPPDRITRAWCLASAYLLCSTYLGTDLPGTKLAGLVSS